MHNDDKIIMAFLVLLSVIGVSYVNLNDDMVEPTYEFREVHNLKCAGINAIGCTTVLPGRHFIIEYVPNSQRCDDPGCITINQTIEHEMNHTKQFLQYGKMWEWE